jgi:GNAT superfamily N-acetyltransferase
VAPDMVNFAIEVVTEATVADVVPLLATQLDEHGMGLDMGVLERVLRGMVSRRERGAIFVARIDGRAIGVAVLSHVWTIEHGGLATWLDELYVVPEHRGRGVGGALLEHAIAYAKAEGCLAVELEVDVEHARAEHLYERNGFLRLPRRRFSLRFPR